MSLIRRPRHIIYLLTAYKHVFFWSERNRWFLRPGILCVRGWEWAPLGFLDFCDTSWVPRSVPVRVRSDHKTPKPPGNCLWPPKPSNHHHSNNRTQGTAPLRQKHAYIIMILREKKRWFSCWPTIWQWHVGWFSRTLYVGNISPGNEEPTHH